MTIEYYQVEERINDSDYWADRDYRLTLAEAQKIVVRKRKKERKLAQLAGNPGRLGWECRIVKVTETREVFEESED